jgi:hypothetical protein
MNHILSEAKAILQSLSSRLTPKEMKTTISPEVFIATYKNSKKTHHPRVAYMTLQMHYQ